MPMQVRHHIAQAGKVDLVGLNCAAQCALRGQHNIHDIARIGRRQVAHFGHMLTPYHATETGESRPGVVFYADYSA